MKRLLYTIVLLVALTHCTDNAIPKLEKGARINSSAVFGTDTLQLASQGLDDPVWEVEGDHITLDFQGTILRGAPEGTTPDSLQGLALHIRDSRAVTIRNLHITGYQMAILAENCDSLLLDNCTFQYLRRLPLSSDIPPLDESIAIVLNDCDSAIIRNLTITGTQHSLSLNQCEGGLVYNNTIRFNAGNAITLRNSSGNRVYHNRLDWNVRVNATDSTGAGVALDAGSSNNIVAYNSLTHIGLMPDAQAFQQNHFTKNDISYTLKSHSGRISKYTVPPIKGAQTTKLPGNSLRGYSHILMGKWGPYSFKWPKAELKYKLDNRYIYTVYGPAGNWEVLGKEGFAKVTPTVGECQSTLTAYIDPSAEARSMQLKYTGNEVITEEGKHFEAGEPIRFQWPLGQ